MSKPGIIIMLVDDVSTTKMIEMIYHDGHHNVVVVTEPVMVTAPEIPIKILVEYYDEYKPPLKEQKTFQQKQQNRFRAKHFKKL